jgi:DNA-binding transcriptional LysR family regulator
MELRHLRYFTAVAEHLNYSEASRRIHVAQPAISQTILDLEEELGVRLLLRDRRTVWPLGKATSLAPVKPHQAWGSPSPGCDCHRSREMSNE